jgi:hypothetical protein
MGSNIAFTPGSGQDSGPRIRSRRDVVRVGVAVIAAAAAGRLSADPGATGLAIACAVVATVAFLPDLAALAGPRLDPLEQAGLDAFRRELDRARRHERPFALLRLTMTPGAAASSATLPDDPVDPSLTLIGASLRITDRAWRDGDNVIVLLPESDRATAAALFARLELLVPGRFGSEIGIAVFPSDGLTSGALLDALERDLRDESMPHAIRRAAGTPSDAPEAILPTSFAPPDDVATGIG